MNTLEEQTDQIKEQVGLLLDHAKEELVDVQLKKAGRQTNIEVTVDRPTGGITLDECASINRRVAHMLEEKGFFEEDAYSIEVVSPGLDRPLKTEKDFLRNRQRSVCFFLSEPLDEKVEWIGAIDDVVDGAVVMTSEKGHIRIPIAIINKAVHNI